MNVLSLFDGISCGQLALQRAGIKVDNYYASEIDKHAIQITQKNWPDTIQLGDVVEWRNWPDLSGNGRIDIMFGGFPCQSHSTLGKQTHFNDPRGQLFFYLVDILKEVKPKYFLFENVKMKKEYQDFISNLLGVQPILINSALVSGQNRNRLYWTNIPNVTQPADKGIKMIDILDNPELVVVDRDKAVCVCANYYKCCPWKHYVQKAVMQALLYKLPGRITEDWFYEENGAKEKITNGKHFRMLNVNELERLQTLPADYTAGPAKTNRIKCIGNAWTVDVIAHILRHIPETKYNMDLRAYRDFSFGTNFLPI